MTVIDVCFKIVISHLDLGEQSEISIRCNVLLNNAQAEPGNLIFKIGNEKLENDDNQLEYDESKKDFLANFCISLCNS